MAVAGFLRDGGGKIKREVSHFYHSYTTGD